MKIYKEELSDVTRYIQNHKHFKLDHYEDSFKQLMKLIKKFKTIDHKTKILEIGTGTGWFPVLCNMQGICCRGLEISPYLVDYAKNFGKTYGIKADIELGNIEETDIGDLKYDIIIASSVFEHVEHWQEGLKKAFKALKPKGLLYFYSTNKFSFKSGEYDFPLYGWMPNNWRYRLRISRQGDDIMKLGIDFNQFTHFQLESFFKKLGFSIVLDRLGLIDADIISKHRLIKRIILQILRSCKLFKQLFLIFKPSTLFICVK
ncbi:hypothetical protein D1BOALGB6SA_2921 [Olavius sp. associated proteobacterium Delta 1]|nr:hypothetical protein D1BOALGB6SA_2921 [Olavius sp. associated proteobacterium Delta 1]